MIGGNTIAQIQRQTVKKNDDGEQVRKWERIMELTGWLDLSSGDSKRTVYYSKVQESTHMFICDFVKIPDDVTAENSRIVTDGKVFDIMLIDDPMGIHRQLEIYLKYTGGQ